MLTISQIRQSVAALPQQMAATSPLLFRELTEMSARRRTYVLRVLYAIALYGFTTFLFWSEMATWGGRSFAMLGRGRDLLEQIAWMQFLGIYLFLPAITSGVLTIEKERDTLSLLLLTRLGPWSILIGKLFSRLVPMATFVLLSLPLVAIAYSLGGVNEVQILSLAWTLSVTAIQVAALALACSAWFRTTAGAMVSAYVIGALLFLGPAILIKEGYFGGPAEFLAEYCRVQGLAGPDGFGTDEVGLLLFGPWVCLLDSTLVIPFHTIVLRTIPIMLFSVTCLFFARAVLWNRAFVQPSNRLLKIFRSLDKAFQAMNQNRLTRGIVLTRDHVVLPGYHPIRWRETTKRSLGTTRYLVRLLLLLEIPVLFGMLLPDHSSSANMRAPAFVTAWVVWVVAALVITVHSSGLIGSERSRQTLDVLLTTPLASETIVREKFAGVWRVIAVIWVPLLTIYIFQAWWMTWVGLPRMDQSLFGMVRAMLALLIYPPLIAWIGFHFSLRCRSHPQAVLATLGSITALCVLPLVIAVYFGAPYVNWIYELRWFSPATAISEILPTFGFWSPYSVDESIAIRSTWIGMLAHFVMAALLLWWLWWRGLTTFAQRVNRNDGQIMDDDDIDRLVKLREHIVGKGIFQSQPDEG